MMVNDDQFWYFSALSPFPTVSFSLVAVISGFQASWKPGSLSLEFMRDGWVFSSCLAQ